MQSKQIKSIAEATGLQAIRKNHPFFDFKRAVEKRLEYLTEARTIIRGKEDNTHKPTKQDEDLIPRNYTINAHLEFVRESLSLLDIYNTVDHPEVKKAKREWTGTLRRYWQDWTQYTKEYPTYVMDAMLGHPHKDTAFQDKATKILISAQNQIRAGMYTQRLFNEIHLREKQGWYFVFDTITLATENIEEFVLDKSAIRDYTRSIGRKVNQALGLKAKDSYTENYRYFMVPEYGSKEGRLHFHCLHMLKALPIGTRDPNIGRQVRNAQMVHTLLGTWKYGFNMPIAVRHTNDAFTRKEGWLRVVDKNGQPKPIKPVMAVARYIAKYITKSNDFKSRQQQERTIKKWKATLAQKRLSNALYRVSMSKNFGMVTPDMSVLSIQALMEMSALHYSSSPVSMILKKNAKNELGKRLAQLDYDTLTRNLPPTKNALKSLRSSIQKIHAISQLSIIELPHQQYRLTDICNELHFWILQHGLEHDDNQTETVGTK